MSRLELSGWDVAALIDALSNCPPDTKVMLCYESEGQILPIKGCSLQGPNTRDNDEQFFMISTE